MPENKKLRVVIDTNILVSSLIGKEVSALNDYLIQENIILLFSKESFAELSDVMNRPKLKKLFTKNRVNRLTVLLSEIMVFVKVRSKTTICRDVKDNFVLNLCYDGKADYLITGDNDLLILGSHSKTKIISFSDFKKTVPLK
ncbi:MAG: putative toxin-antitoxin system toxin component, PIN family [Bacteroidales bacterium]